MLSTRHDALHGFSLPQLYLDYLCTSQINPWSHSSSCCCCMPIHVPTHVQSTTNPVHPCLPIEAGQSPNEVSFSDRMCTSYAAGCGAPLREDMRTEANEAVPSIPSAPPAAEGTHLAPARGSIRQLSQRWRKRVKRCCNNPDPSSPPYETKKRLSDPLIKKMLIRTY